MVSYSRSSGRDDWLTSLAGLTADAGSCVLVTVVKTRGSAPREAGCKMLILADRCVGTIGGGHLEFKVIEQSRELLAEADPAVRQLFRIPLGASLGQCCGGHVLLLLERLSPADLSWVECVMKYRRAGTPALIVSSLPTDISSDIEINNHSRLIVTEQESVGTLGCRQRDRAAAAIARSMLSITEVSATRWLDGLLFDPLNAEQFHLLLFGAGHVGQAIISLMQTLPYRVTWIDSRSEMLAHHTPSPNLRIIASDEPAYEIDHAPSGCYVLVMRHNHQLDLAICERVLQRPDITFCGLIGSTTKRRRFRQRLIARGGSHEALERITCPIGIPGVSEKQPAHIAIAVVAQLLQIFEHEVAQLPGSVEKTA